MTTRTTRAAPSLDRASAAQQLNQLRHSARERLAQDLGNVDGSIGRTVSALEADAAELKVGPAAKAGFRRELLDLRREAQERAALSVLREQGETEFSLFGALVFLASQGGPVAREALRSMRFDSARLERLRVAAVTSPASGSPAQPTHLGDDRSSHEAVGPHKEVIKAVRAWSSTAGGALWRSPVVAREVGLPLADVQRALEDLAATGGIRRLCQAVQQGGNNHWHRSAVQPRWEALVDGPVLCEDCRTWFSARPSEVFIAYSPVDGVSQAEPRGEGGIGADV